MGLQEDTGPHGPGDAVDDRAPTDGDGAAMKQGDPLQRFSLLGGPLHRLGCRLGLVREETNTLRLGLALGLLAWSVLVLLWLLQGTGNNLFSLSVIGVHVRFLVAIPLFFLCETQVVLRMAEFVRDIGHSGLVPESELHVLGSDIRRVGRLKDSWLAEIFLFVVAFALPLLEPIMGLPGRTGSLTAVLEQAGGKVTGIHLWYFGFCLPLFRFLVLRWLWHLGLWWYFCWRVERLKLRLIPIHSDGAAGLGYLEVVQGHFAPLVMAISAVCSASFAENILAGTMAFEYLYRLIPFILILLAVLFVGPLLIFSNKLWDCRVNGWRAYMLMASRYADAFDRRWVRDKNASGESQLGSADIQSLADLTNSVNIVRNMRFIPAGQRLLVQLATAAALPMLPLLFLKFPVDELAAWLLQTLIGM